MTELEKTKSPRQYQSNPDALHRMPDTAQPGEAIVDALTMAMRQMMQQPGGQQQ